MMDFVEHNLLHFHVKLDFYKANLARLEIKMNTFQTRNRLLPNHARDARGGEVENSGLNFFSHLFKKVDLDLY